jgi:hypothetical protein
MEAVRTSETLVDSATAQETAVYNEVASDMFQEQAFVDAGMDLLVL